MKQKHSRTWILALVSAILLLAVLSYFLWRTGVLDSMNSMEQLQGFLNDHSPWGQLVFFLLQLSSVIIAPIPSNITAMAGGACFGILQGFLITFFAVSLGSLITFFLARILGREWAERQIQSKLSGKYHTLIQRKRDSFLALVFLLPFFPDDLICILAGLTDIPFQRFALIVVLTRPWGLLVATALGSSFFSVPPWLTPVLVIAGVLLLVFGLLYGDRIEAFLLKKFSKN